MGKLVSMEKLFIMLDIPLLMGLSLGKLACMEKLLSMREIFLLQFPSITNPQLKLWANIFKKSRLSGIKTSYSKKRSNLNKILAHRFIYGKIGINGEIIYNVRYSPINGFIFGKIGIYGEIIIYERNISITIPVNN